MTPCPRCASPDTVSYWDIKDNREPDRLADKLAYGIMRSYYPDARKCADCDHVWWPSMYAKHPIFAMIRKDKT